MYAPRQFLVIPALVNRDLCDVSPGHLEKRAVSCLGVVSNGFLLSVSLPLFLAVVVLFHSAVEEATRVGGTLPTRRIRRNVERVSPFIHQKRGEARGARAILWRRR